MEADDVAELAAAEALRAQSGLEPEDGEDPGLAPVEIEHEGQVYQVPAALKGAFMRNADYTRKTQELAHHRRGLEAERQALGQAAELAEATAEDRVQLAVLDHQLAIYESADWQSMMAEDPQRARQLWAQFQQTRAVRDDYALSLSHQMQAANLMAERQRAARLGQLGRALSREIEGWSPDVAAQLVEYADAFGITLDELRQVADPRLWKLLHRAHRGEQLAQHQLMARNVEQAHRVRPAAQISRAAASAGGVRDELGTIEWMRRRNEQTMRGR